MDNFYNSVDISKALLRLRTHSTGKLRKNRKSNKRVLVSPKLEKEYYFWQRNNCLFGNIKRPFLYLQQGITRN